MLFREHPDGSWLAVSQPMPRLVSGQMLRAWGCPGPSAAPTPSRRVATAAAQHDVAWMGWEAAPTLDPATGRPHGFRMIGARSTHPCGPRASAAPPPHGAPGSASSSAATAAASIPPTRTATGWTSAT
jgi:hypothetical protein